jgi:hypothetical protein
MGGQVFRALGLSVGVAQAYQKEPQRRAAYACDVTYVSNQELGFDFLRDNLALSMENVVQRPYNFCVVDEADSILIDEARTPLIISRKGTNDPFLPGAFWWLSRMTAVPCHLSKPLCGATRRRAHRQVPVVRANRQKLENRRPLRRVEKGPKSGPDAGRLQVRGTNRGEEFVRFEGPVGVLHRQRAQGQGAVCEGRRVSPCRRVHEKSRAGTKVLFGQP